MTFLYGSGIICMASLHIGLSVAMKDQAYLWTPASQGAADRPSVSDALNFSMEKCRPAMNACAGLIQY